MLLEQIEAVSSSRFEPSPEELLAVAKSLEQYALGLRFRAERADARLGEGLTESEIAYCRAEAIPLEDFLASKSR
jgi:hypothetical protein